VLSIPTLILRCQYAAEISYLTERLARELGMPFEDLHELRARLLHRLFHWMCGAGTHFIDAPRALDRLERLGRRLLRHRLLGSARGRCGSPIRIGSCIRIWDQFSYLEQRVLKLLDLQYRVEEVGLVIGLTSNAVEYYRNQAAAKIHRAYVAAR
jgi:hypothetical protein